MQYFLWFWYKLSAIIALYTMSRNILARVALFGRKDFTTLGVVILNNQRDNFLSSSQRSWIVRTTKNNQKELASYPQGGQYNASEL